MDFFKKYLVIMCMEFLFFANKRECLLFAKKKEKRAHPIEVVFFPDFHDSRYNYLLRTEIFIHISKRCTYIIFIIAS